MDGNDGFLVQRNGERDGVWLFGFSGECKHSHFEKQEKGHTEKKPKFFLTHTHTP